MKQFLEKAALAAICGLAMGLTLLAGGHYWQPSSLQAAEDIPVVMKAKSFQVVDEQGVVRAEMKASVDNGNPSIALCGTDGKARMTMSLAGDDPAIQLFDKSGGTRAGMRIAGNEQSFQLCDKDGNTRVGMRLAGDDAAVALTDSAGKPRVDMKITDDAPSMAVLDQDGAIRAQMGVTPVVNKKTKAQSLTAESSLMLFDKDGNVAWKAP